MVQFIYTGEHVSREALSQLFTLEGRGEHVMLWAAKTVVEMHGGSVHAYAGATGGAVLVIELPMSRAESAVGRPFPTPSAAGLQDIMLNQTLNQNLNQNLHRSQNDQPNPQRVNDLVAAAFDGQVYADGHSYEQVIAAATATAPGAMAGLPLPGAVVMDRLSRGSERVSRMSFSNTGSGLDP